MYQQINVKYDMVKQKPIEIQIKRTWNWIGHTIRKEAKKKKKNCTGLESSGI
jgi:hypothetical protein